MKKSINWVLAGGALIGQSAAYAVGLGAIEVRSGLNEPLNAEIRLNASPADVTALTVQLASAEEFARVGIDRARVGVPLEFTVARNARGEPIIRVTSAQPVREPFLSFLIDVNWPAGRLLREYTVLLDPPVMAPAVRGTGITAAPVRDAAAPAPAAELPVTPPPRPAATEPPSVARPAAPPPAPAPAVPRSGEYGPVAAGETAWDIARATRPDESVSIHQMMLALLQANPQAFVDGNINALRRGVILRIPTAEEARALSQAQAIAEVRAQNDAWRARSGRPPALVADAAPVSTVTPTRPAAALRDDARLELVPPRAGEDGGSATGTGEVSELRADLARTREELASSRQEARELRERVRELEALRDDQERMINIKSSELEAVQAQLRAAREQLAALEAERAAAEAAVVSVPPAPPPLDDDLWGAAVDDEVSVDEDADGLAFVDDAPVQVDDGFDEAVAQFDDDVVAEDEDRFAAVGLGDAGRETAAIAPIEPPAAAVVERPLVAPAAFAPPPAPKPLWQQPWVLGGAGLLVALLAGFGFMRSRRQPVAETQGSLAARVASAGAASGAAGAAAVDAIADPEEARLIAAIDADPSDAGLRLQLLTLYYERSDREAFENAAEAMYGQISDPGQHEWQQVVAMGKTLCPDNDLFVSFEDAGLEGVFGDAEQAQASFERVAEQARQTFDETPAVPAAEPAQASPATATEAADDEDLFGLGQAFDDVPPPSAAAETRPLPGLDGAPESLEPLDFDLSGHEPSKPAAAPVEAPRSETASPAARTAEPSEPAELAVPGLDSIDPLFGDDPLGGDAVSTKLDLAKAYLDMGDPDGARSMLEEVLNEGNEAQRREAQRLIAAI